MIISLNWLKKYVKIEKSVGELATLIGARLVEIEEVKDISEKYRGAVIVEVAKCEKIEGSDHLSLTLVDDCGIMDSIDRDEDGLAQVVCGAPNVRAGMLAVWLPPSSIVPETYGTDKPFVLEPKKLQGYVSQGMLAGLDELDMGDRTSGIAEISREVAKAGDKFSDIFGLDDTLLDIENKSLTHRPDCFGVIGFAREVAGILGQKFETAEWLLKPIETEASGDEKVEIVIEDAELCSRYEAVVMELSETKLENTLLEMQTYLARSGMRPIDRIVDVTNEVMLLTGQPLHAFDYDKLVKVGGLDHAKIIVRAARKGEKLELLDGKTIELTESDIVITSNDVPVALAGAMGGKNTMIDESTKRIILESATFNLYNLRTTQMRHGIFSEAITRFTKGQPPALADYVIRKAVKAMEEYCGVKVISRIWDEYPEAVENLAIEVSADKVNGILGSDYSWEEMETVLRNVGFEVWCDCEEENACKCETVKVRAPYWRTDVRIFEDVAEEIGRIKGFDGIERRLPKREYRAIDAEKMGELKSKIREVMTSAGANEVLTYSFVNSKLLEKAGQDAENSYKIINSISPDLEYCRQSLTPNLLDKAYANVKAGFDKFALYEVNKISQKSDGLDSEKVPVEKNKVAMVYVDRKRRGDAYYVARKYARYLLDLLGIESEFGRLESENAVDRSFENKRSASVCDRVTGQVLGVVGEYKQAVRRAFKLPEYVAGFELEIECIQVVMEDGGRRRYKPISRYPSVERDICFKLGADVEFSAVEELVKKTLMEMDELEFALAPIDIFWAEDRNTRNVTFRAVFASRERTLGKEDIGRVMETIAEKARGELGAEII